MWISVGLALAAALFALVWTPSRRAELAARDSLLDLADDHVAAITAPLDDLEPVGVGS